ncbi:MAG: hypothetical protein ACJ74H_11220, partial [Thermoanaerobaculia bacterium]
GTLATTTTIVQTAPTTTTTTVTTPPIAQIEQPLPKQLALGAALESARRLLTALGAIVGAVLVVDFIRGARRWRRRRQARGRRLPYRWPLQTADIADVFDTPAVDDAVRRLRRRAAGERTQLDLDATVRATAAAGRLATLVHTPARQSARYVVLIERRSPDDQLAAYFHAMAEALAAREVELDVYDYDADPRVCIDGRTGARLGISEIRERHPASRLLIMGSAEALVDPFTAELRDWVETDLEWRVRGALLPDWTGGGVEHSLAPVMAVSRGDAEGLLHVADMLDRGDDARHRVSSMFSDTLDAALGMNPTVRELRQTLDEQTFRWLAACALHPELHWDITIRLGRILLGVIDDRRLLQLVRLRWFREGALPDARREELAEIFAVDPLFAQVHLAVAELLAERKPPPHTYAAEVHSMRAVTHRILAAPPDSLKLRKAMRELRQFSTSLVRGNEDLSSVLTVPQAVPRLGAVVFRGGTPALGVRNFIGTAVLATFALLIAGSTIAARAWSYASPPVKRAWKSPVSPPPPPGVTTTTAEQTSEVYGPPAPTTVVVQVTTSTQDAPQQKCEVRITPQPGRWRARFRGCGGAINREAGWRLDVTPVSIWFVAPVSGAGSLFMLEPERVTFGSVAEEQWKMFTRQTRGMLTVGSVSYPAVLEAGAVASELARLVVDAQAEQSGTPCTGALTQAEPDVVNVHLDEECAGSIQKGSTGELIDGDELIPVVVTAPNMPADRVGEGVVVATLSIKGTLGYTKRDFTLHLGGRTYTVSYNPPLRPRIVAERLELLMPAKGAVLPMEADQLVVFRWRDVGAEEYRLSVDCAGMKPPTWSVRVRGDTYLWAPPLTLNRPRLQCQWVITALPSGDAPGTQRFSVVARELLEVDWVDNGGSVVVDGKIDGEVSSVTVNGNNVVLDQRGRFRTDLQFSAGPLAILTVVTLPDGSQIIDRQTVPH